MGRAKEANTSRGSRASRARRKGPKLQAASNNTEKCMRGRQVLKPGSRRTTEGSKVRKQGPEEFAGTSGGNGDKIRGVIRIRGGLGRAQGGGRRRRQGTIAIAKQHKVVQGELHTARLRLRLRPAPLPLLAVLLLPLPPPQHHAS